MIHLFFCLFVEVVAVKLNGDLRKAEIVAVGSKSEVGIHKAYTEVQPIGYILTFNLNLWI